MAECDLHDFGVGAVTLRWEPATPQDCTTQELKGVIEALHDASWTAVSSLITEVSLACQEALVNDPARLDLARGLAVENVAVLPPVGGALWLWHLLLISCPAATDHRALVDEVASVVCPNDHRVLHQRDHSFAAGVHASVACSVQGMESDATFLARALRTQDPWWTLFWRLDRVLLALQLRLESSLDKDDAAELKKRADLILEVSSRVDLLMSRLDSLLVASGARDIAAWEVLADAWGMPFRVGVVERKLVLLSRAYTEAVARISSNQSARVNFMIYVFTALSVVASVVAVADFAQGTNNSQIGVRLTIVLVSILAALVAVFLSIRTTRLVRARLRP